MSYLSIMSGPVFKYIISLTFHSPNLLYIFMTKCTKNLSRVIMMGTNKIISFFSFTQPIFL